MSECTFERLALIEPLLRALAEEGYTEPTPVQAAAIPEVLGGRDLMATAKTGTGKTAAFALPILQLLHEGGLSAGGIRALILSPTRELALQIEECLRAYGRHLPLRSTAIVGGVGAGPQIQALRRRPDILVATPGRLLDLMGQGQVRLRDVEIAVLDEADRMLDMGFIQDVRRIVESLPRYRQTLLFSATLSQDVAELASDMLQDPVRVEVTPPATVADNIDQKVLFVAREDKRALLEGLLGDDREIRRALVFTRTRHRASRVARQLVQAGIAADSIHSDKSQGARQRALEQFDRGRVRVLVATDIVARGIDVDGITHVINYEIPNEPEAYVHRIGRTARAGAAGVALSFCAADEVEFLVGIERLTRIELAQTDHPYHSEAIADLRAAAAPAAPLVPAAATRSRQVDGGRSAPGTRGGRGRPSRRGNNGSGGRGQGRPRTDSPSGGSDDAGARRGERAEGAAGNGRASANGRRRGNGHASGQGRRSGGTDAEATGGHGTDGTRAADVSHAGERPGASFGRRPRAA